MAAKADMASEERQRILAEVRGLLREAARANNASDDSTALDSITAAAVSSVDAAVQASGSSIDAANTASSTSTSSSGGVNGSSSSSSDSSSSSKDADQQKQRKSKVIADGVSGSAP
jgi:hypothetical protein